jgi:hypothetical protein
MLVIFGRMALHRRRRQDFPDVAIEALKFIGLERFGFDHDVNPFL